MRVSSVADRSPMSTRSGPPPADTSAVSTRTRSVEPAGVTDDPRVRADRLQRELLGLVAAVDADRVGAALAVDAAVGLERRVVPGAEQDRVLARAAVHQVGVVAGHDRLRPGPARDHVGARAGLDGRRERDGVDADLVRARARS